MSDQLGLFSQPIVAVKHSRDKSIAERFAAFSNANPHVYHALVEKTREYLRRTGHKRVGIKMIFEVVRWEFAIHTKGDAFLLNNDFSAHYARMISRCETDLQDVFELRVLRAA